MLTTAEARAFYDAFGRKQDDQGWYEDAALGELVRHGRFERARAVFELGCGTGRFALELFRSHLPGEAAYVGVDLSPTMAELARERLAAFAGRAEIRTADGAGGLGAASESFDRFVSTYVLDLLPEPRIEAVVGEAHRILEPGGLLALVGLTPGTTALSKLVTGLWGLVHRLRPRLVGGCRPIAVRPFLDRARWEVLHHTTVTCYGLSSEVLVAAKLALEDTP